MQSRITATIAKWNSLVPDRYDPANGEEFADLNIVEVMQVFDIV